MIEFMETFRQVPGLQLFIKFHNERWWIDVTAPDTSEKHGTMQAAHGMDFDREKAFKMALDSLNNYIKQEVLK